MIFNNNDDESNNSGTEELTDKERIEGEAGGMPPPIEPGTCGEPDGTINDLKVAIAKVRERSADGQGTNPKDWMVDPAEVDANITILPPEEMVKPSEFEENITLMEPEMDALDLDTEEGDGVGLEVLRFKTISPTIRWAAAILDNGDLYGVGFFGSAAGEIVSIVKRVDDCPQFTTDD